MTIITLVMANNWLGREAELAEWDDINYISYSAYYNEETNRTVINYKTR